jgi:hypothetical protein
MQHSAYAASIIACYHTSLKGEFGLEYLIHNGGVKVVHDTEVIQFVRL